MSLLVVLVLALGLPLLVAGLVARMKRPPTEFEVRIRRMRADFVKVQIVLVDGLTPALTQAAAAMQKMVAVFGGLDEDTRAEIVRLSSDRSARTARTDSS